MKRCLSEFQRNLSWVERLDVTSPLETNVTSAASKNTVEKNAIDPEDDFKREMNL